MSPLKGLTSRIGLQKGWLALISKVLVMTGGPGVGKTIIVNAILRILAAKGTNFCCALRPAALRNV